MLRIIAGFLLVLAVAACGAPPPTGSLGGDTAPAVTPAATTLGFREDDPIYGAPAPEILNFAAAYRDLLAAPQPAGFEIPQLAGYRCERDSDWRRFVPDSEGDATTVIGCKVGQEGQYGIFTWASQYSDGSVTQGVAISRGDHPIYDWLRRVGSPSNGEPSGYIVFGQHPHGVGPDGSPDHTDHQHAFLVIDVVGRLYAVPV